MLRHANWVILLLIAPSLVICQDVVGKDLLNTINKITGSFEQQLNTIASDVVGLGYGALKQPPLYIKPAEYNMQNVQAGYDGPVAAALQQAASAGQLGGNLLQQGAMQGSYGFQLPAIDLGNGAYANPAYVDLTDLEASIDGIASQFCSEDYWNKSGTVPATLTYPSLTITLETGACALYEESVPDLGTPDLIIASKGLVCKSPVVRYSQKPATFTFEYTAPASFISKTCKIAKNTTDFWSKTLYTKGRARTYPTTTAWLASLVNGTQTKVFNFGDSFTAGILEKAISYIDVLGVDVQDLLKTPPKLAQAVQNAAQPIVTSATSSAAAALSGRRLL